VDEIKDGSTVRVSVDKRSVKKDLLFILNGVMSVGGKSHQKKSRKGKTGKCGALSRRVFVLFVLVYFVCAKKKCAVFFWHQVQV